VSASFSFVHASDPHVAQATLPRLQRARGIAVAQRADFVLMSGDLVRDAIRVGEAEASGYYDLFVNEIRTWPMPVWNVPGNHENFGIERHLSLVSPSHPLYAKGMYRQRLGPNYYSFSYGGVHFIGLDSVDISDLWYYGHIDRRQLEWLAADLAQVPPGTTVITFNHIPFVSAMESVNGLRVDGAAPSTLTIGGKPQYRHTVSNLDEVLPLLKSFAWTHALGGHLHIRETIRYASSTATRFYQTAAIVGPGDGNVPAISGVTLYRVKSGVVDDGEFIALDSLK
jgi:3',5'-cyclic AMP phosphodiesterase CpdA